MPVPTQGWMNPDTADLFLSPYCRNSLGSLCVWLGAVVWESLLAETLSCWSQEQVLCASTICNSSWQPDLQGGGNNSPPPFFFCFMMAELYSCSVGTLCASLAEQRRICAFKGNVSRCCLKMQRGISAPNGLRLKIYIDQVRASASVDCLGFSGICARTLLFALSLGWTFKVRSQVWDSLVWFLLLGLGCPLPSFGKL